MEDNTITKVIPFNDYENKKARKLIIPLKEKKKKIQNGGYGEFGEWN